jgi:hypothetical protein
VAEDDGALPPGPVFAGQCRAADHRIDTERRQKTRGNERSGDLLRLASEPREGESARRPGDRADGGEAPGFLLQREEIGVRGRACPLLGIVLHADEDEPLGIGVGQRLQQDRVHNAEDGRVGTDAETERQHGDRGEGGGAAHHPEGVAQILEEVLEQTASRLVARVLLESLAASEGDERRPPRIGRAHPGVEILPGLHVDVKLDLIIQVGVDRLPPERSVQADQPITKGSHVRVLAWLR